MSTEHKRTEEEAKTTLGEQRIFLQLMLNALPPQNASENYSPILNFSSTPLFNPQTCDLKVCVPYAVNDGLPSAPLHHRPGHCSLVGGQGACNGHTAGCDKSSSQEL